MKLKRQLNPTTRKRLQRFQNYRRAYISAWLLAILFLLTLSADLLCNDKPLFVHFEGQHLFPVLKFYAESDFLPEGKATAPNYKALNNSPIFMENANNFMVFAPIPFGPRETIHEDDLQQEGRVAVNFQPIPLAGHINITPDLRIYSALAAEPFFGLSDSDIAGQRLDNFWSVNTELRSAIESRFLNKASPPLRLTVAGTASRSEEAMITLSPFNPRAIPPKSIRIIFRSTDNRQHRRHLLTLDRTGNPTRFAPAIWKMLTSEEREQIRKQARDCYKGTVNPLLISIGEHPYQVLFDNSVAWPYPPVKGHWLGIDSAGRDVLSRIVHGLRVSLIFGILLVSCSMFIGIIVGAIQGYYGGFVDITVQRLIEIWSAIPFLYVMILLGSIYGSHFWLLLVCYAIFNWIGISYYIRGEFLRLRNQAYVDAARVLGLSSSKIIFRHVLPNAITPIITFIPFYLVGTIAALAALDYLGFGLPPLTPSLGQLLHQAQTHRSAWWLILYPSLALFIVMLLVVFVGEGIREAYDPRPRTKME